MAENVVGAPGRPQRSPAQRTAVALTPEEAAGALSGKDLTLMFVILLLSLGVPLIFILISFSHGPTIWKLMSVVFAAGAFGGFVNALLCDNGLYLPHQQSVENGIVIVPGFFGNVLVGAVAGTISWGLYGPLASATVVGPSAATSGDQILPVSALVSAFVVGIGGARWLTNEVDKKLLSAAAVKAAAAQPDPAKAQSMQVATPRQAFDIASTLQMASPPPPAASDPPSQS